MDLTAGVKGVNCPSDDTYSKFQKSARKVTVALPESNNRLRFCRIRLNANKHRD
jgi:hypothetical protein